MKRISLLVLALTCLMSTGCMYQWIDSGNVGVRVNASGSHKGIDPKPLGVGRAWYNPLTETIHEFPVFEQNVVWAGDEAFMISSAQSAQITVDVGLVYEIQDDKVPVLFDKLRRDIEYISHQWMKNHVREAIGRASEKVDTMSILGEGKGLMLDTAKADLNKTLAEYGIVVKMLSFVSAPKPEAKIQASIDATITAKQLAIQAENKIVQSKAEADQAIEQARGRAESVIVEAEADFKKAELQAKGNKVLAESVTPALTKYYISQKWDGKLPRFTGSVIPMLDVEKEKD